MGSFKPPDALCQFIPALVNRRVPDIGWASQAESAD